MKEAIIDKHQELMQRNWAFMEQNKAKENKTNDPLKDPLLKESGATINSPKQVILSKQGSPALFKFSQAIPYDDAILASPPTKENLEDIQMEIKEVNEEEKKVTIIEEEEKEEENVPAIPEDEDIGIVLKGVKIKVKKGQFVFIIGE